MPAYETIGAIIYIVFCAKESWMSCYSRFFIQLLHLCKDVRVFYTLVLWLIIASKKVIEGMAVYINQCIEIGLNIKEKNIQQKIEQS